MDLRRAGGADIPRIIDMIEALTVAVRGPLPVDRAWTGGQLAGLIGDVAACVFVTKAGFIAGAMRPTLISARPVAFELGWWASDGSGLRLLRAYEAWARAQGVALIQLSTGAAGLDLSRLGYVCTEIAWVKAA